MGNPSTYAKNVVAQGKQDKFIGESLGYSIHQDTARDRWFARCMMIACVFAGKIIRVVSSLVISSLPLDASGILKTIAAIE